MKKDTWKTIIQVVISVLTAALTALGTTSCMGHGPIDIHLKKAPIKREQSQACLSYVEREGVRQSQKASTEWSGLELR